MNAMCNGGAASTLNKAPFLMFFMLTLCEEATFAPHTLCIPAHAPDRSRTRCT